MQYNTINTIQCNIIQYNAIYNKTQYNTIQFNTIQYNTMQCNTAQLNTASYNTTQHNTTHTTHRVRHSFITIYNNNDRVDLYLIFAKSSTEKCDGVESMTSAKEIGRAHV